MLPYIRITIIVILIIIIMLIGIAKNTEISENTEISVFYGPKTQDSRFQGKLF